MGSPIMVRRLTAEFLGTFALCFLGIGAILATQGQSLVAIAFAHGLAIGLMILAVGHISGGHFNPAVTVGLFIGRRINVPDAIAYIVAQVVGAVAACLVLLAIFPKSVRDAQSFGIPAVGKGFSVGDVTINFTSTNALVAEIVTTFFLVFVVYGTAIDKRSNCTIAGLAIGLIITADIFAVGAVSGAAMNPARYLGPAIVDGNFTNAWIWIVGPVVGGLLAGLVYSLLFYPEMNAPEPREVAQQS